MQVHPVLWEKSSINMASLAQTRETNEPILTEQTLPSGLCDTFCPTANLRGRVIRGGFWVFALRIADRLFR